MSLRQRSFQFVENNSNYVVHVTRGQQRRRFEISRLALFGGAALLSLVGAAVIAAAGYLVFRDDLLAGLIERQTQMQYAYEDRLAAARLRLDQVASRQFIDSDGVEGKVRSLVIRQAMLETRAAVVARLLEHTVRDATGPSRHASRRRRRRDPPPEYSTQPRATQSAIDDSVSPLDGKPRPEGFDLRPGHSPSLSPRPAMTSRPTKSNPAGKGEDHAAVAAPNSEAATKFRAGQRLGPRPASPGAARKPRHVARSCRAGSGDPAVRHRQAGARRRRKIAPRLRCRRAAGGAIRDEGENAARLRRSAARSCRRI